MSGGVVHIVASGVASLDAGMAAIGGFVRGALGETYGWVCTCVCLLCVLCWTSRTLCGLLREVVEGCERPRNRRPLRESLRAGCHATWAFARVAVLVGLLGWLIARIVSDAEPVSTEACAGVVHVIWSKITTGWMVAMRALAQVAARIEVYVRPAYEMVCRMLGRILPYVIATVLAGVVGKKAVSSLLRKLSGQPPYVVMASAGVALLIATTGLVVALRVWAQLEHVL